MGVGREKEQIRPIYSNHLLPPKTLSLSSSELAELRAKFEEDKKRVAALRESRRFRPT